MTRRTAPCALLGMTVGAAVLGAVEPASARSAPVVHVVDIASDLDESLLTGAGAADAPVSSSVSMQRAMVATPTDAPADTPTATPTDTPTATPTDTPTATPGPTATSVPTAAPTPSGTDGPVVTATADQVGAYCGAPARTAVPGGQPIVVAMAPGPTFAVGQIVASAWRHPWNADNNWRLHFEGFTYLPALAGRAYLDGQRQSLDVMVGQLVAFHAQNPDPGTSQFGWDEGTAMRRLATESCLYLVTRDARLRPAMAQDAAVQLGDRYYGPPLRPVHNHGLMANLELVKAGDLLGVPTWVSRAVVRMAAEAPLAFTPRGTTWEQASAYQLFNVATWRHAADVLASFPDRTAIAAQLRASTDRGQVVAQWLTEPDGRLVQIGDSDAEPGPAGTSSGRLFRDDQAGYVVWRGSWTDPRTTYYTLRYGPPRRAHGHVDHGAVTWSVLGNRVLVGPGRYRYNTSPLALWRTTAVAQNVALPLRGTLIGKDTARVTSAVVRSTVQSWTVRDAQWGVVHVRGVNVNASTHRMQVVDGYSGRAFRQVWHLDPGWVLTAGHVGGRVMVFRHATTGRVLRVTTTGAIAELPHGRMTPIAGWSFPSYGVALPAYQLVLRSTAATVTTVFTVT